MQPFQLRVVVFSPVQPIIKATLSVSLYPPSGPFELPEDYELASPVYAISHGLEFNKDVKLFVTHFAKLQDYHRIYHLETVRHLSAIVVGPLQ